MNYANRVMSNERRMHGANVKAPNKADKARDEARRSAQLEKAREQLAEVIDSYIKFLTDKTLPKNRSLKDRERQTQVLGSLPSLAAELNRKNVEEGSMVVASTCLNSVLVLRDETNKLRYENYFLNSRVDELTKRLDELEARIPKEEPVEVNSDKSDQALQAFKASLELDALPLRKTLELLFTISSLYAGQEDFRKAMIYYKDFQRSRQFWRRGFLARLLGGSFSPVRFANRLRILAMARLSSS